MSKAAEIAGTSIEGFKSLLESKEIKRIVHVLHLRKDCGKELTSSDD